MTDIRVLPGLQMKKSIGYESTVNFSAKVKLPIAPPKHANFALTEECNSRCKYCVCWKLKDRPRPTLDEICRVLDSLSNLGVKELTYAGGEPLLHPDLDGMVEYAHKKGFFIIMMTNSILATGRRVRQLLDKGLNNLTLSMDSINPDTFKLLRGFPLKIATNHLDQWLKLKEEYPHFEISVNSVICKASIGGIADVVRYCHNLGVSVTFQILHPTFYTDEGFDPDLQFTEPDLPRLQDFVQEMVDMKNEGYKILASEKYLRAVPDYAIYHTVPDYFRCRAGYESISIDNRLTAYSCWTIGRIGDLKKNRLEDLWFTPSYQRRRNRMWKVQCEKCWLTCHAEDWS